MARKRPSYAGCLASSGIVQLAGSPAPLFTLLNAYSLCQPTGTGARCSRSLVAGILPPPGIAAARPWLVSQESHPVVCARQQVPGPLLAADGSLIHALQVSLAEAALPACNKKNAFAAEGWLEECNQQPALQARMCSLQLGLLKPCCLPAAKRGKHAACR